MIPLPRAALFCIQDTASIVRQKRRVTGSTPVTESLHAKEEQKTQHAAKANAVRCISRRSTLHFLGHYCAACSPSLFSGQQHVLTCTKSLAAKALSPRLKKPQAGVQYRFTRHGVKQANRFLHSTIRLSLQTKRNCAKETVTASALAQPYP